MDKVKPIDRKENNIENKIEDYKDSNGNPEDFIEDMTDPEATAIFKEAFYAEGKALEEEALRSPFVEDEEKKEALRLRILAAAGRSAEGNAVLGHKATLENGSNDMVPNKAVVRKVVTESASGDTMTLSEAPVRNDDTVKASVEDVKEKKKRRFTPFMRWVAVLSLVCVGVFGMSVTGQAKGSGLWSTIQRLIGGETRWEQDDNGEDRNISDPDEYKAIEEIQEKLGINIPKFFYWPDDLDFENVSIFEDANRFMMQYTDDNKEIYFVGWTGETDSSTNSVWQGESFTDNVEYNGTTYAITELENDVYGVCYYVKWNSGESVYSLSGIANRDELEKILKNIKN